MQKSHGGNNYIIVYNGELYNTEELRSSLKCMNFDFTSYSDTEVLLTAYMAWGPECAGRLNGIFSFAVWDSQNKTLFMCRDPLGVNPLFYTINRGVLIFGSEIKAPLAHPNVDAVIDESGICEILGLGPARSPDSGVFKDIFELPPACRLLHSREKTTIEEYWTLKDSPHTDNEGTTCERIRALLTDAIRRQLVSDVPLCAFLSGGLDSSIISAVSAAELSAQGKALITFSVEYANNSQYYEANDFQPAPDDE